MTRYSYTIEPEEDATNPRHDYDNACTMLLDGHRNYDHGDKDAREKLVKAISKAKRKPIDPSTPTPKLAEMFESLNLGIIKPVYMMDHSGLTITTERGRFEAVDSTGWDWGLYGYVFITNSKIKEEWGSKPDAREKAEKCMDGEVETLDMYMRGDVWRIDITDEEGETVDSLGWCFGHDWAEEEAKAMIKRMESAA